MIISILGEIQEWNSSFLRGIQEMQKTKKSWISWVQRRIKEIHYFVDAKDYPGKQQNPGFLGF